MEELLSGHDFLEGFLPGLANFEVFDPWGQSSGGGGNFIGDPGAGNGWMHQTTPFTCAVVSQMMILQEFGLDVSEAQLTFDATSNGWLTEMGTSPEHMASLLEYYGVGTHSGYGGGIESLVDELAHGRKVIVAVDSGELWGTDFFFSDWLDPNGADHAIVVTGMDTSDPNNIQVYVNDPGDPSGAGRPYPLDQFVDAWSDSGQYYIATNEAPEGLASHSFFGSNFNSDSGWYFDPGFWQELVAGFVAGGVAAEATLQFINDETTAAVVGGLVTAFATFSTIIDAMPEDQVESLFYSI